MMRAACVIASCVKMPESRDLLAGNLVWVKCLMPATLAQRKRLQERRERRLLLPLRGADEFESSESSNSDSEKEEKVLQYRAESFLVGGSDAAAAAAASVTSAVSGIPKYKRQSMLKHSRKILSVIRAEIYEAKEIQHALRKKIKRIDREKRRNKQARAKRTLDAVIAAMNKSGGLEAWNLCWIGLD